MVVRNHDFYNLNESRAYPLDDSASLVSSDGIRLPSDLIVDLHVAWPEILGRYAFVSSFSVTPNLVTVTLQAADSKTSPSSFSPLAVVSLSQPVSENRIQVLQPQYPGVGGWIVLGSAAKADDIVSARFDSPLQTLIAARAGRWYKSLPVESIGKLYNSTQLTGLVTLRAEEPLEIEAEDRLIDGVMRQAAVIRLVEDAEEDSVFSRFSGRCGQRPESRTCPDPQPIEFVNGVAPDCDGDLTIEFKGCSEVAEIASRCGAIIDCDIDLLDTCVKGDLPAGDGTLPNEYRDLCDSEESESSLPTDSESVSTDSQSESSSESISIFGELPYQDCFDDGMADQFVLQRGEYILVGDDSPGEEDFAPCEGSQDSESGETPTNLPVSLSTETSTGAAGRNIITWESFDEFQHDRTFRTDVKVLEGPSGALRNAGIVMDHRDHPTLADRKVYYLVSIDIDNQKFRVSRFNGTIFQVLAEATILSLGVDRWYRIEVTIDGVTDSSAKITASLSGIEPDTGLIATLSEVPASSLNHTGGYAGFWTDRSWARFSFWRVEESS